jgi:hypothetical protein
MFYSFNKKDIQCLLGVVLIVFGWLLADQIFLPEVYQRFIALFLLLFLLFFAQFKLNKPVSVWKYANTLVVICLSLIITISIVIHVFILHNFDYRPVLIWILTAILPYFAACIYQFYKITITGSGKVDENPNI